MIKVIYKNNNSDIFKIDCENESDIIYKDYAQNFIKINKLNLTTFISIDNEWVPYNSTIISYQLINEE